MGTIAVVLVVVVLAGSAALLLIPPTESSRGPSITTPKIHGEAFVVSDGARLPFRVWSVDPSSRQAGPARPVVLALHGAGSNSSIFSDLGRYLATQSIIVYAYDQRGHGNAPDFGAWVGMETLVSDLTEIVELVRTEHPAEPIYISGQSLGAAVILNAAAKERLPSVDGVILISPAVNARRSVGRGLQLFAAIGARIAPTRSVPRPPDSITSVTDNPDYQHSLLEDPLNMQRFTLGLVYGALTATDDAMAGAERLTVPTLLLYGEHDVVIDAEDFQEASRRVAGPKRVISYPDGYHALLVDNQRERVFEDIATWIARMTERR